MSLEIESTTTTTESNNPYIPRIRQFFESALMDTIYELVKAYPSKRSLNVDFKALEKFDFELADELLEDPDSVIQAAEEVIQLVEIPSIALKEFKPLVRFYNLPADKDIFLREIGSEHANKLISVEGIIKQITDILPKLKMASFKCNRCGTVQMIKQTKDSVLLPSVCECRHKDFSLLSNNSVFIDYQKLQIQEPLEKLRGNEQPTNLEINVLEDLVNKANVGDKIKFTGVLRLRPQKKDQLVFIRFLEATHIEETSKDFVDLEITKEEIEEIKKLAKDPEIYEKLVASVAPNIYGHDIVKESIILQLFGGVKKMLPNGQNIRGNIHVLLVGDPGMAKSQLLQASHNIAPKSVYVAGKTTSAAGLTTTAVKDEFAEGSWTLKAGALVLASGGTVMADELDKMPSEDRSALHEAMEQGMISVAKAGIITRFKTDTSILAAANPKYSRFDPSSNILLQIDLPSTLISRFDLFFVIRDVLDKEQDREISMHILKTNKAGEIYSQHKKSGLKLSEEDLKEIEKRVKPAINPDLLRKYISFTRQSVFPSLTEEAIQELSSFYVDLREKGKEGSETTYTATHRQLEGLVRLSEASARIRLSDQIEKQDALRALRLVKTSLEEVIKDPSTGKLDIDYITSGQPQSMRTQLKSVLNLIKELARDFDLVPREQVLDKAKELGISKEDAIELIKTLLEKGELMTPKSGYLKPVPE